MSSNRTLNLFYNISSINSINPFSKYLTSDTERDMKVNLLGKLVHWATKFLNYSKHTRVRTYRIKYAQAEIVKLDPRMIRTIPLCLLLKNLGHACLQYKFSFESQIVNQ